MFVIREHPVAIWTNAEILERMETLGWKSTAKTRSGVTGMLAAALATSEDMGQIEKVGCGKWKLVS